MKFLRSSVIKKTRELRRKRDKGFFTAGLVLGVIASGVAAKFVGQCKCKKCVKRLLAEKK